MRTTTGEGATTERHRLWWGQTEGHPQLSFALMLMFTPHSLAGCWGKWRKKKPEMGTLKRKFSELE